MLTRPEIMRWFDYEHLAPYLQAVSRPFGELARDVEALLPVGEERDACLRKLLEAKDCAVRAAIIAKEQDERFTDTAPQLPFGDPCHFFGPRKAV